MSCCRYSFCKACLIKSGQRGSVVRCPLCRTTDAGVSKDRTYDDSLQLVLVRCKEAPCCAWQGAFTAVEEHEEACEVRFSLPHTIPISHLPPYTQFSPSLDLYLSPLRVSWEVGKLRRELRQKEDELKEYRVKDLHHEWVVEDLKQEHNFLGCVPLYGVTRCHWPSL